MSNLCSEILQVNSPSSFNDDLSYEEMGSDISCNLGSMNIALAMDSPDFGGTVEAAIRGLTAVADKTAIDSVPSIRQDRKSTRLNSSHVAISYAVFCLKKKKKK